MRTLHRVWTLLALAAACAPLTGCGTATRRVDASPFILGDPSGAGTTDAGAFAAPAGAETPREPAVPPPAEMRAVMSGATIESADPRLAAALLAESVAPTADNHLRVAQEYLRLGILDAAHGRFTRALERDPRMAAAHEGVARLWRDWGMLDRALGSAYRAVFFDASGSALNTLGTVLDALGHSDDALAAYSRALDSEPDAGWALSNLCSLSVRLGRLTEARTLCEAALELSPTQLRAHNNLALTYAATGDLEGAREAFAAAGDPAGAAYNLGILHLSAGNFAAAADAFEAAIAARPDFTEAKARAHAARLRTLQRNGAADDK